MLIDGEPYAIEHAAVIYPPNAARLVGQHRLDGGPFIIAEFGSGPITDMARLAASARSRMTQQRHWR
ncbi:hypothetical protein GCM10007919_16250 [Rhizobium indigoferae]|nr:hypothetical protein GCM10007919_16250 [Rhizobium indigoferae]